jgi:dihydroxyacid dehydratase/phosphogluconate dehydratase
MIHAGYRFDLWTLDQIRRKVPVPDLFDYSLTQGRDIYALAQQCEVGEIRGMETLVYELVRHGVPMNLDAPTVTGTTWAERLRDTDHLPADGVKENPIVLSEPRRPFSGADVLQGNFFDSAVVKMSGMTSSQISAFDDKVLFVLYYENEEEACEGLLDVHLLDQLGGHAEIAREDLLTMYAHNRLPDHRSPEQIRDWCKEDLFDHMIAEQTLKWAVVISGQGPEAYGMPEMFTPMQHINSNRTLSKLVVILSDGRYSGVTYGAAIGHVTPEAMNGGGILYLQTGDVLHLCLRERCIYLLDKDAFRRGALAAYPGTLAQDRVQLGGKRRTRIKVRRRDITSTNRLQEVTDAAHGVVPEMVAEEADRPYEIR